MKLDTPELSNVSNLDPAFTATVIDANGDVDSSETTLSPFSNWVKAKKIIVNIIPYGLSYLSASGISPVGNSPKSTNADFENCN